MGKNKMNKGMKAEHRRRKEKLQSGNKTITPQTREGAITLAKSPALKAAIIATGKRLGIQNIDPEAEHTDP